MFIRRNLLCLINDQRLTTEVVPQFAVLIVDMEILVISNEDSRLPIVDLARTMGDMVKHEKLFPEDVSIDLIDENLIGISYITSTDTQKTL
jgi:undecaprenyl pyrophosphate synthase